MTLSEHGPAEQLTPAAAAQPAFSAQRGSSLAIEARNVDKVFRLPLHRVTSLKERVLHPLATQQHRDLHALNDVSFDVHKGEFFGIVGRNGSGKSTLLKILAGIYGADGGTIRMAGRVAPFIELGVGFNVELTARQNVVLNGVMMGLRPAEARKRLDAVLEFAELEEFVDLKLKNYSSGMLVRLAFSVMIQADADILLVDEVLAVGDVAFQQKCGDVFREMRDAGRTIVLVTHDMAAVQSYCHRAMLIHDGKLDYIGDPEEVGRRYYQINFAPGVENEQRQSGAVPDVHARLVDAHLEDAGGARTENVELGEPIRFRAIFEATSEMESPVFGFHFEDADGTRVFGFNETLDLDDGEPDRLAAGERAEIAGTIENRLMPGRYFVTCWVCRNPNSGGMALQVVNLFDFIVFGQRPGPGLVSLPAEVSTSRVTRGAAGR